MALTVEDARARIAVVRERIARAAAKVGRDPSRVKLVAVSKTHSAEMVRAAYDAGHRVFGENYVKELAKKADELAALEGITWHFIGHLQRNKVKDVVRARAVVETVDSVRLAEELSKRSVAEGIVTPCLVQVNVGGEAQKSGCEPSEAADVVTALRSHEGVRVSGVMTVPPLFDDPEASRPFFRALRELAEKLGLDDLSMGMTHDLEVAVEEGATIVRVGTAIFGPRE
jgi:pyridoxal phosphate enzyme (YggS family)